MDCVLGYHLNPLTCGVARFNRALAEQLGLPVHPMFGAAGLAAEAPLLSFKTSEMSQADLVRLAEVADDERIWPDLRLFFHDYSGTRVERTLIDRAQKVYCGNEALVAQLTPLHASVVQAWCPGYLFERRQFEADAEIKIYTFGMAHKLRTDHFRTLRQLLERTGRSYIVYISAAIHEGTSLDDSFTGAYEELKAIFGDRVFFIGFVSDAALYSFLKDSTYFAAFFETGVRANNTSVSTAMQCGAVVLTNLDDQSPPEFQHLRSVIDIRQCEDGLPLEAEALARVAEGGRQAAKRRGWAPLKELFLREEAGLRGAADDVSRTDPAAFGVVSA